MIRQLVVQMVRAHQEILHSLGQLSSDGVNDFGLDRRVAGASRRMSRDRCEARLQMPADSVP